ncbi:MAG: CDP-glycerol glycerophosphotransferase family protein [Corynebacterium sp.]|nr:CDP-glycerol glycerophosphotransferase family protein [Corynebacterium sp.]
MLWESSKVERYYEVAGQIIAGKLKMRPAQKLVQFAAVRAYERHDFGRALSLYSSIPGNLQTDAVKVRIAQLMLKSGDVADARAYAGQVRNTISDEVLLQKLDSVLTQCDELDSSSSALKQRPSLSLVTEAAVLAEYLGIPIDQCDMLRKAEPLLATTEFEMLKKLRGNGDQRLVVNQALKLTGMHPESALAWWELAVALFESGQILRARDALSQARNMGLPRGFDPMVRQLENIMCEKLVLADIAAADYLTSNRVLLEDLQPQRLGNRGQAICRPSWSRVDSLFSVEDPSLETFDLLVKELYSAGRFDEAVERFRALSTKQLSEVSLDTLVLVASSDHRVNEDVDDAILEAIIARRDWDYAEILQKFGLEEESLAALVETEIRQPRSSSWWSRVERVAVGLGRGDVAVAAAVMAAAISGDRQKHFRAGLVAEQFEDYDTAIQQFSECIKTEDSKSTARLRLALVTAKHNKEYLTALAILKPFWKEYDTVSTLELQLEADSNRGTSVSESDNLKAFARGKQGSKGAVQAVASNHISMIRRLCSGRLGSETGSEGTHFDDRDLPLLRFFTDNYLIQGNIDGAILTLWRAAYSMETFEASIFHQLGYCYALKEDYETSLRLFAFSQEVPGPFQYEVGSSSARQKKAYRYLELMEHLPINEHVWLWESHFGRRVDCNPYAMYLYASNERASADQIHIWVVNKDATVPDSVAKDPSAVVTTRESFGYWLALATAKYLTNNASFPFEYMHRDGQVHVNTWHGTPLKYLGRDDKDSRYDYGNVGRNLVHATNLLMPNRFTSEIMTRHYEVDHWLGENTVQVIGYPRNDVLSPSSESEERARIIREALGIPSDGKPVVLYAPTWRGSSKAQKFDVKKLIEDLEELSQEPGWHFIFRGHPLAEHLLKDAELPAQMPSKQFSTYDLMLVSDIVVTDYSSLGIDFLTTGRPVIYYTYDFEDYSKERGLYFPKESFPGVVVETIEQLTAQITDMLHDSDHRSVDWSGFRESYAPFDDGQAARRAVEIMLESDGLIHLPAKAKKTLLIHSSLTNISSSYTLINNLQNLDFEEWEVTLTFDHAAVLLDHTLPNLLDSLPPEVRVYPRKGGMIARLQERGVANKLYSVGAGDLTPRERELYRQSLRREAVRLFGGNRFDIVVEWGLEGAFWTALIAEGVEASARWLVLDRPLDRDSLVEHPNLLRNAQFLDQFDLVVGIPSVAHDSEGTVYDDHFQEMDKIEKLVGITEPLESILMELRNTGTSESVLLAAIGGFGRITAFDVLEDALSLVEKELGKDVRLELLGAGPGLQKLKQLGVRAPDRITVTETNEPYENNFEGIAGHVDAIVDFVSPGSLTMQEIAASRIGMPLVKIGANETSPTEIAKRILDTLVGDRNGVQADHLESDGLVISLKELLSIV